MAGGLAGNHSLFFLPAEPHLDHLLLVALSSRGIWALTVPLPLVQTWASRMPEEVCCRDFWEVCVFFRRDIRLGCSFITVAGEGVRR